MAHILRSYIYHALTGALKREPTEQEMKDAVQAVEKEHGEKVFEVFVREE